MNTEHDPFRILRPTRLPRRGHAGGGQALPVKPFNPGRIRFIKVRVSDEEHEKLTRLGKSQGGISGLVRVCLLGKGLADRRRDALLQLSRLGRNFNLIAREATRYEPARAAELLIWLVAIDRALNEAIERFSKAQAE